MRVFVTGGAGFIGSNIASNYISKGADVTIFDDMSRKGVQFNLDWLNSKYKGKFNFIKGDVRDFEKLRDSVKDHDIIFHTAAQVTVTDSVKDPRKDLEINGLGTFNVLEAARLSNTNPTFIYTSTNKVYGEGINDISLKETDTRWVFDDPKFSNGISESFNTDFDKHTPYGDSKYVGDLYTREYSHTFGIPSVVFRQSCIYGTRQFGNEDQGWIAHFVISSILNRLLNIYGDGKQVRDVLFIDDLVKGFEMAIENISKTKGKAYNIGGGKHSISLLELMALLEKMNGNKNETKYYDWRPADQKVYISDTSRAKKDFGWEPKVSPEEGISKLNNWVKENINLFK